ncbi:hypothetical protein P4O66_010645 [Electrophorus voltai]|uniref:Ephrin RBD domain-containing protein n=1 Tax=Electrophorus voltai TaxID=2609070 RepID=A0AAD9DXX3_9TELE|nr:hypothetical protein P4O66_010645 [Electrophorus voltai]
MLFWRECRGVKDSLHHLRAENCNSSHSSYRMNQAEAVFPRLEPQSFRRRESNNKGKEISSQPPQMSRSRGLWYGAPCLRTLVTTDAGQPKRNRLPCIHMYMHVFVCGNHHHMTAGTAGLDLPFLLIQRACTPPYHNHLPVSEAPPPASPSEGATARRTVIAQYCWDSEKKHVENRKDFSPLLVSPAPGQPCSWSALLLVTPAPGQPTPGHPHSWSARSWSTLLLVSPLLVSPLLVSPAPGQPRSWSALLLVTPLLVSPAPGQPAPDQPCSWSALLLVTLLLVSPAPGQPAPGQPAPGQPCSWSAPLLVSPAPGHPAPGQPRSWSARSWSALLLVSPAPGHPAPGQPCSWSPRSWSALLLVTLLLVSPTPGQPAPGQPHSWSPVSTEVSSSPSRSHRKKLLADRTLTQRHTYEQDLKSPAVGDQTGTGRPEFSTFTEEVAGDGRKLHVSTVADTSSSDVEMQAFTLHCVRIGMLTRPDIPDCVGWGLMEEPNVWSFMSLYNASKLVCVSVCVCVRLIFSITSTQFTMAHLRREGYTLQVHVNDYLDIYCPHYNSTQRGVAEQYVLYMVSYRGYRTCDPQLGFKRWECNRPHAPHAPIKFSEKFQRYSAFSLGYEFHVGHEYYYISTPTHHHGRSCLRLRVYVCCSPGTVLDSIHYTHPIHVTYTAADVDDGAEPTEPDYTLRPNINIDDLDDYDNPEAPKLEKSISGRSPSRDRLLLTVATLFLIALSIS